MANRSSRKIMENKREEVIEDILEVHFLKMKKEMLFILKESSELWSKGIEKDKDRHLIKC